MHTLTAYITGTAIITPHGTTLEFTAPPPTTLIQNPQTLRHHHIATVPAHVTSHLTRQPRLRRASAISLLAAAAAQTAITHAAITPGPRTALILAVSNGCAQYTRRFYHQIITTGAHTASPLLFPETVHNAPASHIAAILGLDGATYTLIGDGTIGLQALHFAAQLLHIGQTDHAIIVAAEESDTILSEAHHHWRLTSPHGTIHPHRGGGTLLAEGAAAIILAPTGHIKVTTSLGCTATSRRHAPQAMHQALIPYQGAHFDHIIDSANGTWTDHPQLQATAPHRHSPKAFIGEAVGASALQQLVLAAHQRNTLVTTLGWNQHAAAALVS